MELSTFFHKKEGKICRTFLLSVLKKKNLIAQPDFKQFNMILRKNDLKIRINTWTQHLICDQIICLKDWVQRYCEVNELNLGSKHSNFVYIN